MTFGNFGGFVIDFVGPTGDLMYGQTDGFYDPCSQKVTVGVGVKVAVTVRVSVGVSVGVVEQQQTVQVTAQTVQVTVSQPSTVQNPVRQNQKQQNSVTIQQILTEGNSTLQEFANQDRNVGVTLLTPKALIEAQQSRRIVQELAKEVAIDLDAGKKFADFAASGSDEASRFVQGLFDNRQKAWDIMQKSGFSFEETKQIMGDLDKGQAVKNNIVDFIRKKIPTSKIMQGIQNTIQDTTRQLVGAC